MTTNRAAVVRALYARSERLAQHPELTHRRCPECAETILAALVCHHCGARLDVPEPAPPY